MVCRQLRTLSVGVTPACIEARKKLPPRPLGVGVIDEEQGIVVVAVWSGVKRREEEAEAWLNGCFSGDRQLRPSEEELRHG